MAKANPPRVVLGPHGWPYTEETFAVLLEYEHSIPPGEGVLVLLDFQGTPTGVNKIPDTRIEAYREEIESGLNAHYLGASSAKEEDIFTMYLEESRLTLLDARPLKGPTP